MGVDGKKVRRFTDLFVSVIHYILNNRSYYSDVDTRKQKKNNESRYVPRDESSILYLPEFFSNASQD
jgi:hypothetical protein